MIKIGILSDLHMEFDKNNESRWDFVPQDGVLYICAGDIDSARGRRHAFLERHAGHMLHIMGNHDFYGYPLTDGKFIDTTYKGLKIAGATLWTDLSIKGAGGAAWFNYNRGLVDSRFIEFLTYENYTATHERHKKFLLGSGADIIVSHHCPSTLSTAPQFIGNILNNCFVNSMEEEIMSLPKPPKIWICGHTHHKHEYMLGETRVICHPRGYPGEIPGNETYEPMIIEVDA